MEHHPFYSLFTTTNLIFLYLGMASTAVWYWNKCRKNKQPLDWIPVGIIAGVATIVFIVMQQSALAQEVKACQKEFQTTLSQRADITDEADDYIGHQVNSTVDWLSLVVEPPQDILNLPANDPRRREWVVNTKNDWREKIDGNRIAREKALQDRKNHQYPEPTCGK